MLDVDLKGKKLLLLGGINNAADLVDLAHRNSILIGVADYNKGTYVKSIADYEHEISVYDEDAIIELVRQEHYDGIITAFNERLGAFAVHLGERLDMPVPFTEEQFKLCTDKKFFKHICLKYGVPVPREYRISDFNDIFKTDIEYPVIVKPVDGASSVGISVCPNLEELVRGYKAAVEKSKSGGAIVEQYIDFDDEVNLTYLAQDGDIQLTSIHDRYFNMSQEGAMRIPNLCIYPSRYTELYLREYNELVINMLKGMGVKDGTLFMQAIVKNGKIFIYETGMRLCASKAYQILEYDSGYNTLEHLMQYALTGSMGKQVQFHPKMKRWYATIHTLGIPGATIAECKGKEELENYPWLVHIAPAYRVGDTIPQGSAGTFVQDATRIHVAADTKEELLQRIAKVNQTFRLLDPKGLDIILTPHNLHEVDKRLDYDR